MFNRCFVIALVLTLILPAAAMAASGECQQVFNSNRWNEAVELAFLDDIKVKELFNHNMGPGDSVFRRGYCGSAGEVFEKTYGGFTKTLTNLTLGNWRITFAAGCVNWGDVFNGLNADDIRRFMIIVGENITQRGRKINPDIGPLFGITYFFEHYFDSQAFKNTGRIIKRNHQLQPNHYQYFDFIAEFIRIHNDGIELTNRGKELYKAFILANPQGIYRVLSKVTDAELVKAKNTFKAQREWWTKKSALYAANFKLVDFCKLAGID